MAQVQLIEKDLGDDNRGNDWEDVFAEQVTKEVGTIKAISDLLSDFLKHLFAKHPELAAIN